MTAKQMQLVFVNGTAMRGGDLSHNLAHSEFLGEVSTAPRYRFFSIRDEFPGLMASQGDGASIAGELYRVDLESILERFLPDEPKELELNIIHINDGRYSLGMTLRPGLETLEGATEITKYGGWRAYMTTRGINR